jgi:hypothetical protein
MKCPKHGHVSANDLSYSKSIKHGKQGDSSGKYGAFRKKGDKRYDT